jgi:NhaP-type Na+/H+ or K+/H+ antiporter
MIVPWVSYLAAESFELSGIVSIMFCGIAMAQYSLPNMSAQAKTNIKQVLHTVAENFEA